NGRHWSGENARRIGMRSGPSAAGTVNSPSTLAAVALALALALSGIAGAASGLIDDEHGALVIDDLDPRAAYEIRPANAPHRVARLGGALAVGERLVERDLTADHALAAHVELGLVGIDRAPLPPQNPDDRRHDGADAEDKRLSFQAHAGEDQLEDTGDDRGDA